MEQRKLKQLLSEMSLREKIGQMIQLTGIYFDDDAVLTGEVGEDQPPQWVTQYAGSVLGMIGAEKLREFRKNMWKRIRIIFHCCLWQMSYMGAGP
ncbi:MAG: hypothetical protein ACLROW_15240 [Roseburia faecis]